MIAELREGGGEKVWTNKIKLILYKNKKDACVIDSEFVNCIGYRMDEKTGRGQIHTDSDDKG